MAEVARAEGRHSGAGGGGEEALQGARRRARAKSRTCRSGPTCRTARTPTTMSSTIISGPSATTALRPSSISIWARRSARWISRPRRSCPARASWCLKSGLARLERALGQFMLDLHTSEHGYTEVTSAAAGARRGDVRHGAIAEVCRGSVSRASDDWRRTLRNAEVIDFLKQVAVKVERRRSRRARGPAVSGSSPPPKSR